MVFVYLLIVHHIQYFILKRTSKINSDTHTKTATKKEKTVTCFKILVYFYPSNYFFINKNDEILLKNSIHTLSTLI